MRRNSSRTTPRKANNLVTTRLLEDRRYHTYLRDEEYQITGDNAYHACMSTLLSCVSTAVYTCCFVCSVLCMCASAVSGRVPPEKKRFSFRLKYKGKREKKRAGERLELTTSTCWRLEAVLSATSVYIVLRYYTCTILELVLRSRTVLGIEYVRGTWLGGNQNPREFDIFHGISLGGNNGILCPWVRFG